MGRVSGNADKPQVKIKVRSIRALKKYCREPKCLRCGYDLRGQFMSGGTRCPECGQACIRDDLADQISGQRAGYLPVVAEVRSGVMAALCIPLICLFALNALNAILNTMGIYGDWIGYIYLAVTGMAWLICLPYTLVLAYRAMGSWRGPWCWFLSFFYALLFIASLATVFGVLGLALAVALMLFSGGEIDSDFVMIGKSPWVYISFGGAMCLMWFNQWWSKRLITIPCRRRCRELALRYLTDAQGESHPAV